MRVLRGVNPVFAVLGILRRGGADGHVAKVAAVQPAGRKDHAALAFVRALHAAAVAQIHRVKVLLVRPDTHIRAHGYQALGHIRIGGGKRNALHRRAVIIDRAVVNHAQLVPAQDALRLCQRLHRAARQARAQKGVGSGGQVLHGAPFAVPNGRGAVEPAKLPRNQLFRAPARKPGQVCHIALSFTAAHARRPCRDACG